MRDRRSLALFFGLVFLLSLPFWIAGARSGAMLMPGLPFAALMAFCPALAAAILIYRRTQWSGVCTLLARSFDYARIRARIWYAPTLLLMPAVTALSCLALRATGRRLPVVEIAPIAEGALFATFFLAALGEELGWSGYALDPLQRRLGALPAALALGLIWAIWHYVPLTQADRGAEWIAWWTLGTVSKRVIMVWLYNGAGRSVFAVALFHAIGNLCELSVPAYYDPRVSGLILAPLALLAAIGSGRGKHGSNPGATIVPPA